MEFDTKNFQRGLNSTSSNTQDDADVTLMILSMFTVEDLGIRFFRFLQDKKY